MSQSKKPAIDRIRAALDKLFFDKKKIPKILVDMFEISAIMASILNATKEGEIWDNIAYQIKKVLVAYEFDPVEIDPEIQELFKEYINKVQEYINNQVELAKKVNPPSSPEPTQ